MKKLSLITLLATLTVFVACNNDDDPVLEILLDGEALTVENTYHADYGTSCFGGEGPKRSEIKIGEECTQTHSIIELVLTDGQHDGDYWFEDYSYILFVDLFSTDLEGLEMGEYEIDSEYYERSDLDDLLFGTIYLESSEIDGRIVSSGTVTLSGSLDALKISVDGELEIQEYVEGDWVTVETLDVTGTYKGDFSEEVEIE